MKKVRGIDRGLLGTWISSDEVGSTVEHRVRTHKGIYQVQCVDAYDGKVGEVYDVNWDGERLRYCVYWASSGRFAKNSILRQSASQVVLTYTFTDTECLRRKRVGSKKRK